MEMKVTYEIENGKMVKVESWDDGDVSKYDENGNEIHYKNTDGFEEWYEYDSNGKIIHSWNNRGVKEWY